MGLFGFLVKIQIDHYKVEDNKKGQKNESLFSFSVKRSVSESCFAFFITLQKSAARLGLKGNSMHHHLRLGSGLRQILTHALKINSTEFLQPQPINQPASPKVKISNQ